MSATNAMQRVDGFYLYQVGLQIHPLSDLRWSDSVLGKATTQEEARYPVYIAEAALEPLISRSVFSLKTSVRPGNDLLIQIRTLKEKIDNSPDTTQLLTWGDAYSIQSSLTKFEAVLGAELSLSPLYVVTQKAGFDTATLIENGMACFPSELWTKVPESIFDIQQATKCIAYEVFTAAGFHLFRATETVLHKYWDVVSNGKARPPSGNMGDYLNEMKQGGFGADKVKAALSDIKNLERNPLIHPDYFITNVDDAIALMNSVHTAIVHMLREIPATSPTPEIPAGGALSLAG